MSAKCDFVENINNKMVDGASFIWYRIICTVMKCLKCHRIAFKCNICGGLFLCHAAVHISECSNVNVYKSGYIANNVFTWINFVVFTDQTISLALSSGSSKIFDNEIIKHELQKSYPCIFCGRYYESPPSFEVLSLHIKNCIKLISPNVIYQKEVIDCLKN